MKTAQRGPRLILATILLFSISALYASSSPSSAASNETINADVKEGLYFIRNVYSGKYLDVCANGRANRTKLQQFEYCAEPSMQWYIKKYADGYYTLVANHSRHADHDLLMDSTVTIQSGTQIQIYERSPTTGPLCTEQQFRIQLTSDAKYMIIPKYDERYAIGLGSATTANNAPVVTSLKSTGSSLQKWELVPLEDIIASTFTFASYNMGHDASGEALQVYNGFRNRGFMAVDHRDTKDLYCSAYRMKSMSRYADIVYLNGHGGRRCNLYVENYTGESDTQNIQQYLMADTSIPTDGNYPKVGIGARWKDSSCTATTSTWDLYTKWVIFGGCGQMNYKNSDYNDGAYWNGLRSAQIWALTMKSSGRKVHGIMGYYGQAPGTKEHKNDMDRFFDYLDDHTIAGAWEDACNGSWGVSRRNWAVLYYGPCQSDKVTQGRIVYTEPSASDYIYYKNGYLAQRIDNTLHYSVSSTVQSASFLTASNQEYAESYPAVRITAQPLPVVSLDSLADGYHVDCTDNTLVIQRTEKEIAADAPLIQSQEDTYRQAVEDLTKMGLLPASGSYSVYPSEVQQVIFDSECNPLSETPDVLERCISFYQTYKGRELFSDQGNGIHVVYDGNGLKSLRYQWKEVTEAAAPVSLSSARRTDTDAAFVQALENDGEESAYYVSETYVEIGGTVHRAKAYCTDPGFVNPTYVDIETGAILA